MTPFQNDAKQGGRAISDWDSYKELQYCISIASQTVAPSLIFELFEFILFKCWFILMHVR